MTSQLPEESSGESLWRRIMGAAMKIPGAKVDRASYLRAQLTNHCREEEVREAVQSRPAAAGISPELIDKLAEASIESHVLKASAISFGTGLPGGWAMTATIPADIAQYFWHAIVLSQKLAYLYGWPDILESGHLDEEGELRLTLLMGAMMGAAQAKKILSEIAGQLAAQVSRRMPLLALTKTFYYPIVKQVARWIGVRVTKQSFAGGVAKVIPLVGGAVSATLTATLMWPMANRLRSHLATLKFALPDDASTGSRAPSPEVERSGTASRVERLPLRSREEDGSHSS